MSSRNAPPSAVTRALFGSSEHTSQRAESAVQAFNEASANVETAAAAADELSRSIGEISRQLTQTSKPMRRGQPTMKSQVSQTARGRSVT